MAKKPSGLGRGLGDLLDDNTPEVKKSTSGVVIRQSETPARPTSSLYDKDKKPKNKSLKANYR